MQTEYMSPEERAKAVVKDLPSMDWEDDFPEAERLVASAIRAAENDMAERAIDACRKVEAEAWGNPAEQAGAIDCIKAIEALKHKDP